MKLGMQTEGQSSSSIKEMALRAFASIKMNSEIVVADIGAGRGDLEKVILPKVGRITMVDDFRPEIEADKIDFVKTDLNGSWNLQSDAYDFVFSLEVIEHVENPRHFVREISRILKPGGYGFISTPNNLNLFSRINFFLRGEHRFFRDYSYPAHISCLVKKDFERILKEVGLTKLNYFYNYEDVIPFLGMRIHVQLNTLSNSIGILFRKQA